MSTTKALLLALLAASSLTSAQVEKAHQNNGGNIKLSGPSVISTSTSMMKIAGRTNGSYTYEVDLVRTSSSDTVINIADVSLCALPQVSQVTIPAGQTSATFQVVAALPGTDVLTATSGLNVATLAVTVL